MGNSSKALIYLSEREFDISSNMDVDCDIINENFKHYKNILFPPKIQLEEPKENQIRLKKLELLIGENKICPEYPEIDIDESCEMNTNNLELKIKTFFLRRTKHIK